MSLKYDGLGRLIEAYRLNASGLPTTLFAKFTYNALGWRTSAVYDLASPDGNLANEVMEQYACDPPWRMVASCRRRNRCRVLLKVC